jgi:hypothetical protein
MANSSSMINRMIRASKLQSSLYEEVEADKSATSQALLAVIIVSIIAGIGVAIQGIIFGAGGLFIVLGFIGGIVASLVGWLAWSFFAWLIGTTILKGPETSATWGELLRTIGFAYSPGVFRFFAFIPILGGLISFLALIWSLVAGVIAVRQALDFSTGRAIATCIIGWIIYVIIAFLVGALLFGGAMSLF